MNTVGAAAVEKWPPMWWILVRHEWRLTMREAFNAWRRKKVARSQVVVKPRGRLRGLVGLALILVALHVLGLATLALPKTWHDDVTGRSAAIVLVAFLSTFMLSSAMSRVVAAFHERRDLDLLLSAPIAPRLLLAVRTATVASATTALFALFVFPIVDVGVVTGHGWMARLYALIPLLACLATAVALSLTDLFVRAVGVRRARIGLQIFSGVAGASVYLFTQARQFLPPALVVRLRDWIVATIRVDDAPWPVVVIAALARGDWSAWLGLGAVVVGACVFSVVQAQKRFLDVAQVPEADSRVVHASRTTVERRIARGFRRGLFATLLQKEWRLILRAPQLISQVLLQLLYLMPLMFVAFSQHGEGRAWGGAALAAGVVGVGTTLAASLAWLAISGEDAPDLMAGSPRRQAAIVGAKVVAAALPPLCFVLLAASGMATRAPVDAVLILCYGVLGCVTAAMLAAAAPLPGKRSDFQRRHQGRTGSALLEMLQFILWAVAAGTAVAGYWLVALPSTLLALVAPAVRAPRLFAAWRARES